MSRSRHRWEESTGHRQFWGQCEEAKGKALRDSSAQEQLSPSVQDFLLFPPQALPAAVTTRLPSSDEPEAKINTAPRFSPES